MLDVLALVEGQLQSAGYDGEAGTIVRDFHYLSVDSGRRRAGLVAFAGTRTLDLASACIVVEVCHSEPEISARLSELRYTGAPIAFLALPDRIGITSVLVDARTAAPTEWVSYDELPQYIGARKGELGPRSLSAAKRGARQLTFFDIDPTLLGFAEEATRQSMVERFGEALDSVESSVRDRDPRALTQTAIFVLAARILQDKLGPNGGDYKDLERSTDARTLIAAAESHFHDYFAGVSECMRSVGFDAVESIYQGLSGITFGSLTNDTLGYFYEHALVPRDVKKELGIYYTPRVIAERILRRLPVEDLPLERRSVLDGTCGSGNLLLAAHGRLAELLPSAWSAEDQHTYLKRRLWGIDKDPVAGEVARLSLLLYSLPAGNDWRIRENDVFLAEPTRLFGDRPDIIVGNPPFRQEAGTSYQTAANVLERYLNWLHPGGLLGVVLPISILETRSGRVARDRLLNACDVLEVWHLPEGAIPSSTVGTAVVLGRKRPEGAERVRGMLTRVEKAVKLSSPSNRTDSDALLYRDSYVVDQDRWYNDPDRHMKSSSLDALWERFETFQTAEPALGQFFNGVQPGKGARATHLSETDHGLGWRKALNKITHEGVLEPFVIRWASQQIRYIRYPSPEIFRPRKEEHFQVEQKVVLNATRNASSWWRLKAAVDTERLVVLENFHYIIPNQGTSATLIAALLNSMFVNAWYSNQSVARDVTLAYVRRFPVPDLTEDQVLKLQEISRAVTLAAADQLKNAEADELYQRLDDAVFDAYGCSQAERTAIRDHMARFRRPGTRTRRLVTVATDPESVQKETWRVLGIVEAIHPERRTVSIWIEGLADAEEIPIPQTMPGWLLRPGTGFFGTIAAEQRSENAMVDIRWFGFEPVEYGYLSDDELMTTLLNGEDPHR
jgi:hypothetical protein